MTTSLQSNKIYYAIDIDCGSAETLSNIYMTDGHIRFVTDNYDPIANGATYEDTTDVTGTWEKDILKVDGIDEAGIQVDLSYGATYSTLNGFSFTIFNMCSDGTTPYHKGIVDTASTYIVGSTLTLYVIIDNVFYKRWSGVVSDYNFDDEWFKFNADDKFITGYNLLPKETIGYDNYPHAKSEIIGSPIPISVGNVKYAKLYNIDTQDYIGFGNSYLISRLRMNVDTGIYQKVNSVYNDVFAKDEISQQSSQILEKTHLFTSIFDDFKGQGCGFHTVTQDQYFPDGNGFGIIIHSSESPSSFVGKYISISKKNDPISTIETYNYYKIVDCAYAQSSVDSTNMRVLYIDRPISDIEDEGNFFGRITSREFSEIIDDDTIQVNVYDTVPYNSIVSNGEIEGIMNLSETSDYVFSDDGDYTFFVKKEDKIVKINPKNAVVDSNKIFVTDGTYDCIVIPHTSLYSYYNTPAGDSPQSGIGEKRINDYSWSSVGSSCLSNKNFIFDDVSIKCNNDMSPIDVETGNRIYDYRYLIEDYGTNPVCSNSLNFGVGGLNGPTGVGGIVFKSKFNKSYFNPNDYANIYPIVIGGGYSHVAFHKGYYDEVIWWNTREFAGLGISCYGLSETYFGNTINPMGEPCEYRFAVNTAYIKGINYSNPGEFTYPLPNECSRSILYYRMPTVPTSLLRNKQPRFTSIYDMLGLTIGSNYTGLPMCYMNEDKYDENQSEYTNSSTYGYYNNTQNCESTHESIYRIVEVAKNNRMFKVLSNPKTDNGENRPGETSTGGNMGDYRGSSIFQPYITESSIIGNADVSNSSPVDSDFNEVDKRLWENFDDSGDIEVVFDVYGYNNKGTIISIPYTSIHKIGFLCRTTFESNELYARVKGEKLSDGSLTDTVPNAFRLLIDEYNSITADYTEIDATRSTWNVGRYISESKNSFDYIKELCEQSWVVGYTKRDGTVGLVPLEEDIEIIDQVHNDSIILRDSIDGFSMTSLTKVCNEIQVNYDYNEINSNFDMLYSIDKVEEDSFPLDYELFSTDWVDMSTRLTSTQSEKIGDQNMIISMRKNMLKEDYALMLQDNAAIRIGLSNYTDINGNIVIVTPNDHFVYVTLNSFTEDINTYYLNVRYTHTNMDESLFGDFDTNFSFYETSIFANKSNNTPVWKTYVQGISSYSDAKDAWSVAKNAWHKSHTINQYPIKDLSWFNDLNNFYETDIYDRTQESAYKHFRKALNWSTEQKYQVKYSVPITSDTVKLEIMDTVGFSDKLITGDLSYFNGYISKLTVKPYDYKIELELTGKIAYVTPSPIQIIGDIIEHPDNVDWIVEDEANTDFIVEVGAQ